LSSPSWVLSLRFGRWVRHRQRPQDVDPVVALVHRRVGPRLKIGWGTVASAMPGGTAAAPAPVPYDSRTAYCWTTSGWSLVIVPRPFSDALVSTETDGASGDWSSYGCPVPCRGTAMSQLIAAVQAPVVSGWALRSGGSLYSETNSAGSGFPGRAANRRCGNQVLPEQIGLDRSG